MQQSSDRFSTLLSSHIISVNKSAYFCKSWLWCLEAIWVFTISAAKQLILQVAVLWLSPDAFWCRSASTMSGTFVSLCRGAVLLKRHSNPNHSMVLCIPWPFLDPSDLCKQGLGPLGTGLVPWFQDCPTRLCFGPFLFCPQLLPEPLHLPLTKSLFPWVSFNEGHWFSQRCEIFVFHACWPFAYSWRRDVAELLHCLFLFCCWLICFSTRALLWEKINITEKILVCFKYFVSFLCWEY